MAEQDITITITIPAAQATHLDVADVYSLAEETTVELAGECRDQLERAAEGVLIAGEQADRGLTDEEREEWVDERLSELAEVMGESLCVAHAPAIDITPEAPPTPAGAADRMMALQSRRAARLHTEAALMMTTPGTSLYAALVLARDEQPTLEAIDTWIAEIHAELSTSKPEQGSLFGAGGEVGRG